jgi:hypothetical protein
MHPLGCFGSSLAFDPASVACQSCSGQAACEDKVRARHPQMQKLLSRFTDAKGEMMSVHWMSPAEKRRLKEQRKAQALAEAELRTYGDPTIATGLKAKLDTRVHALVNRMSFQGINPHSADLPRLAKASGPMAAVLDHLSTKPRSTMQELTAAVAQRTSVSDGTAQRDAYAAVSILVACDRAKRVDAIVELK